MDNNRVPTENIDMSTESQPKRKLPKFRIPKISLKNINKNTVLAFILAVILLLVGVTTFLLTRNKGEDIESQEIVNSQPTTEEKSLTATIKLQEGSFQVKSAEDDWREGNKADILEEGYSVRTVGVASRVVIAFTDGSELRIDANSEVSLESVRADRIVIKHLAGYTYNRVMPAEGRTYIVASNDAKYEAKGTAFKTATTGDEQAVEVYHNSVIETNSNKSPKSGQKLIVKSKVAPTTSGKIESLDIEKVKADDFVEWNRGIDSKDDRFKNDLGFLQDVTPPEVTLKISDGEVIFLDSSATEGTIEISGNTEANAKVAALSKSQSGAQPVEVTVGTDGSFTTPVMSAPLGSSVFEFVVKDRTGNTTTKTLRLTFQRKSQPIAVDTSGVTLSGEGDDSLQKVLLSWVYKGSTKAPDGVKLLYSTQTDPVYGDEDTEAQFVESGTDAKVKYNNLTSGETYYFKVCILNSSASTCTPYSNEITVTIP